MNIIIWVILGIMIGVITELIDPDKEISFIGTALLGIIGSLMGGFASSIVFDTSFTALNVESFILAVFVSLLMLFLTRAFRKA